MIDLKTVEDLTNAFGPSGFEEEVLSAIKAHSEGLFLRNDAMHNVYAYMSAREREQAANKEKSEKPVLMLDAHLYIRKPEFLERDIAPVAQALAGDERPLVVRAGVAPPVAAGVVAGSKGQRTHRGGGEPEHLPSGNEHVPYLSSRK